MLLGKHEQHGRLSFERPVFLEFQSRELLWLENDELLPVTEALVQ